jgi:hypothetical protein
MAKPLVCDDPSFASASEGPESIGLSHPTERCSHNPSVKIQESPSWGEILQSSACGELPQNDSFEVRDSKPQKGVDREWGTGKCSQGSSSY